MGYEERHLLPGERVLYKTRLHWVLFVKSILVTLAGVILRCTAACATASGFATTSSRPR